jgi:hypothetical protein
MTRISSCYQSCKNEYVATTQLEYWYTREINGDYWSYDPRLAADGSTFPLHTVISNRVSRPPFSFTKSAT